MKYVKEIVKPQTVPETIFMQNTDLNSQMNKVSRLMARCRVGLEPDVMDGVLKLMKLKMLDTQGGHDESDNP